jgi:hypothetical protein
MSPLPRGIDGRRTTTANSSLHGMTPDTPNGPGSGRRNVWIASRAVFVARLDFGSGTSASSSSVSRSAEMMRGSVRSSSTSTRARCTCAYSSTTSAAFNSTTVAHRRLSRYPDPRVAGAAARAASCDRRRQRREAPALHAVISEQGATGRSRLQRCPPSCAARTVTVPRALRGTHRVGAATNRIHCAGESSTACPAREQPRAERDQP